MSVLKNFTVVDLVKTRSASVATVSKNTLKFNPQTAGELHYAPFVQILVNPKEKQFAIRACKETDANAVPFSKPEGEQKYPIKITSAAIVDVIRKMADWTPETNWNVPGIFFADEEAIVYDVTTAEVPVAKGGRPAKRKKRLLRRRTANYKGRAEKTARPLFFVTFDPFPAIWSNPNRGEGRVKPPLFAPERSKFAFSVARQHGNNESPPGCLTWWASLLKRKEVIWIIQFRIFLISDRQKHGLFSEI